LAKEVLHQLEMARDRQELVVHEEDMRCTMKLKTLGLSSLQRTIVRHESHILWLSEGDAPTKFFHVHASKRSKSKFIRSLDHSGRVLVDGGDKANAAFDFFNEVLGTPMHQQHDINLQPLQLPRLDLVDLGNHFTEAEVLDVIRSLPPDKTLGPDGFTACFLQSSWGIIRADLMAAFDAFWRMDMRNFHSINDALLVLLPKSSEVAGLKNYRPISLIHLLGKLFSKVLATRLTPKLSSLVHPAQSAFIKGHCIQDNFKVVQATVTMLHSKRIPIVFLKVDISRAFDSVLGHSFWKCCAMLVSCLAGLNGCQPSCRQQAPGFF
jgi:hypothetical protein